jgi:hypothetical protein
MLVLPRQFDKKRFVNPTTYTPRTKLWGEDSAGKAKEAFVDSVNFTFAYQLNFEPNTTANQVIAGRCDC